jgi:large subunit ribosomal protein L30
MSFFRVTLKRSGIGMPETLRGTLAALGLHRRGQTAFHDVNRSSAAQIFMVKELVDVEEVDSKMTKYEMKLARRPDAGFWVEKAVPR